jgi:hypothetical protein
MLTAKDEYDECEHKSPAYTTDEKTEPDTGRAEYPNRTRIGRSQVVLACSDFVKDVIIK